MRQYTYYYSGRGDIDISSEPTGATVYVDGYALQDNTGNLLKTPVIAVGAMNGIREIQVSMDGYYSKKVFVDVLPNMVNKVHIKLLPIS